MLEKFQNLWIPSGRFGCPPSRTTLVEYFTPYPSRQRSMARLLGSSRAARHTRVVNANLSMNNKTIDRLCITIAIGAALALLALQVIYSGGFVRF